MILTNQIGTIHYRVAQLDFLGGVFQLKNQYTAIIKQEGDCWIGWIEEISGVNCQENTVDELKKTLMITLQEAIDFNKADALSLAGVGYREELIAV